jgi:hypothetical protein
MKKQFCLLGMPAMALVFGFVLAGCGSGPKAVAPAPVDLTGVSTYYVQADGDDKNAGISEDAPFKTLQRALEAAAKTPVKKITVIGTLVGNTTIEDADPTVNRPIKYMDATGGQNFAEVLKNQVGVATVEGSLDEPDPDEITITGKPDASGAERAVLTLANNDEGILNVFGSTVRLEHIEISGLNTTKEISAISVVAGSLTLGKGAKVTKNISGNMPGIYVLVRGLVIMRDDAEISHNEGAHNVGVYLESGSVIAMFDNALITGNKATTGNGGGVALSGSSLIMYGNSTVSGNSAGNGGGGIVTFPDTENGYISQITMEDNAVISGNTAKMGGGILLQDKLILQGNAKIVENSATEAGGGVWGAGKGATVTKGEDAVIADNQAPEFPDTNFTFN